jgi:DNA-binding transcriptional ArsR family regulator
MRGVGKDEMSFEEATDFIDLLRVVLRKKPLPVEQEIARPGVLAEAVLAVLGALAEGEEIMLCEVCDRLGRRERTGVSRQLRQLMQQGKVTRGRARGTWRLGDGRGKRDGWDVGRDLGGRTPRSGRRERAESRVD